MFSYDEDLHVYWQSEEEEIRSDIVQMAGLYQPNRTAP